MEPMERDMTTMRMNVRDFDESCDFLKCNRENDKESFSRCSKELSSEKRLRVLR